MNEFQEKAVAAIEAQQAKVKARSPQWMVGEQLKDICARTPEVEAFEREWLAWVRAGAPRGRDGKPALDGRPAGNTKRGKEAA